MKAKIWKISQINAYIREIIDGDLLLHSFFAEGEISNLKLHTSGHIYFTLKDEKSAIHCVMFKTYGESITFDVHIGMKVIVCGYVSVYEKTGQLQLYAEYMEPSGKGRLYAALEQLKVKLRDEGLFDEAKKKPIPAYPGCIALITSKTGAAVQDMMHVAKRRNPNIRLVVYPVAVQGENAPAEIVSGIKNVNAWGKADLIILGRGGGSMEDLWAFNDEAVARAIHQSKLPVISAVGHETDFTVADLAADMRAPTPSAAAELASPELTAMKALLADLKTAIADSLHRKTTDARERLNALLGRNVMRDPAAIIHIKRKTAADLYQSSRREALRKLSEYRNQHQNRVKSLENISPLKVIQRGYVLVKDKDGAVAADAAGIDIGERITCRFRDGAVVAAVKEKRLETFNGKEKNGF